MDSNKPVVLYADDDADDRMLLADSFGNVAPEVKLEAVSDGYKALNFLETCGSELPRLLILDMNMPGLSGKEVLKQMRHERRFDTVPVVIFTTSSSPADKDEMSKYGVDMLTKPTSLAEFETTVNQLLAYC